MSAPCKYYVSGGDIMVVVDGSALRIDHDTAAYLLDLNANGRRLAAKAVEVHGSQEAADLWRAAYDRHNQLSAAMMEAGRWAKASGVRA